jgi:DNA-binding NarL/FixJ family response regulator
MIWEHESVTGGAERGDGMRIAFAAAAVGGGVATKREVEVARLLARGLTKSLAARELGISQHTVNRHTTNLMAKLGIHNRAELALVAVREGWIKA